MIARGALRCSVSRRLQASAPRLLRQKSRRYSTSSFTAPMETSSPAAALSAFTSELDKIAPRFDIQGSQVKVIRTPSEFYETLKAKILAAEDRIFLSTLYIGKSEHELISTIHKALSTKPKLKISILTDCLRGTREAPNPTTASLLAPLVSEFGPERVEIRMYHTPNLTGLRKKYIPKRINEGWGLQHMKLYGIDDEIIMSGANLSSDYFSNRQDRYHLFSSKEITNYFSRIHDGIASLSYNIVPAADEPAGFILDWPTSNEAPCPLDDPKQYVIRATAVMGPLIKLQNKNNSITTDTTVYPLSQFTQVLKPDTSTELPAVISILRTLATPGFAKSSWTFTAGYFNPDPLLRRLLIETKSERGTVVTASPWANGFYGSKGVSGLLPSAYTFLARRFLEGVRKSGRSDAITLKEWRKGTVGEPEAWTYHAKGLWVAMPNEENPSITLIGSSNYTKRSYNLDLEANALVVTKNEDLKKRLGEEQKWLQEYTKEVGIDDFTKVDRRVSLKVRIAMWIVSLVGGAL